MTPTGTAAAPTVLTAREHRVLQLLADGLDTRAIGHELGCSERTVKSVVHELLGKLGARTRAHAVAVGARARLL